MAKKQEGCVACDQAAAAIEEHNLHGHSVVRAKNYNHFVKAAMQLQDRSADKITEFAGSLNFVYIHGIWFGIWILLNVGLFSGALTFDAYPFGFLTMIVSLEAIFLSTFVMVSQNRHAKKDAIRGELDFETTVRSEVWSLHIGAALNIDPAHVENAVQKALDSARESEMQALEI